MTKCTVRGLIKAKYIRLLKVRGEASLDSASISFLFPPVDSVCDVIRGFNSTIFAYGQTGSGKTYTMFGQHWDDN